MTNQDPNLAMEKLIANALQPVIRELRMIDVASLIAFLTFQQHNQVSDLVDSATEQFFAPDFISYRDAGDASIDWNSTPIIKLSMVMNSPDTPFVFWLALEKDAASIQLVDQMDSAKAGEIQLEQLERAIRINSIN